MIPIAKPYIGAQEQAAVADVLASGMLASGPRVREFEAAFGEYCESLPPVACSSGTAGLCVAMSVLDLPPGSKVLTTPFSFIATANCVRYANCVPVFADIDEDTFMLTADGVREALDRDPEIRAILPVHLYGQASEIHAMVELARERGIYVIEDCAQAHGAQEHGVPVGGIGDLGVFSFYPTKNMTTGEGGIITGRNKELLDRCRLFIDHGAPVRYKHTTMGFNYRMTSIAAAIGLVQLKKLPAWNAQRIANAKALSDGLRDLPGIQVPYERPDCVHVFHQYVLTVEDRAGLQQQLTEAGVGSAIHYPCTIPDQPIYQSLGYTSDSLHRAKHLSETVLSLPVHPSLSAEDIAVIIKTVRSFAEKGKVLTTMA